VDPRVGLDDLEERKFLTLPGLELRSLSRPAHSQSLHRLRYPEKSYIALIFSEIVISKCLANITVLTDYCKPWMPLAKPEIFKDSCIEFNGHFTGNSGSSKMVKLSL
jgi:hypothetical protein